MADRAALYQNRTTGQVSEVASPDTVGNADAVALQGQPISGAASSPGQILIYSGTDWVPGDPFVQGVYPPGTNTSTGGISGGPINPVLVGGSDFSGTPLLHDLKVDSSGQVYANILASTTALTATGSSLNVNVTGGSSANFNIIEVAGDPVSTAAPGTQLVGIADGLGNSIGSSRTTSGILNTVQVTSNSGGTTVATSFVSDVLQGDGILVVIAANATGGSIPGATVTSVMDSEFNIYQQAILNNDGTQLNAIYYIPRSPNTAAITITVVTTVVTQTAVAIYEINGSITLDQTAQGNTTTSPVSAGPISSTTSNEFAVASVSSTTVLTAGGGWSTDATRFGGDFISISQLVPLPSTPVTATATWTGLHDTNAVLALFQPGLGDYALDVNVAQFGGSDIVVGVGGSGEGIPRVTVANDSDVQVNLTNVGSSPVTLGQKTSANSVPVVIASDQSAITITGSITATNPSVGNTGSPVPAEATYIAGINPSLNLQGLTTDASGSLFVAYATTPSVSVTGSVAVTQSTSPWVISGAVSQSGSWTVTADAGTGTFDVLSQSEGAVNTSTQPANAIQVAGWDGANLKVLSTDSSGNLNVNATFSGTVNPGFVTDRTSSGSITSTQTISINTQGATSVVFNITGAYLGNIFFEASVDGTNWVAATCYPQFSGGASTTAVSSTTGQWVFPCGGVNSFRVRGNTVTSGTATVWLEAGAGSNLLQVVQPTGSNLHVDIDNTPTVTISGTVPVSGTIAATQSGSWTTRVVGNAGGIVDTPQNAAAPANAIVVAGIYNSSPPTISNGNATQLQTDSSGNLFVNIAAGSSSGVQYLQGTIAVTPTGTVAMAQNPSNAINSLKTDSSGNLYVNVASGSTGNAAAGPVGSPPPSQADYLGASDGTNLRGLLVESTTYTNLRVGIYAGATEMVLDGSGRPTVNINGTVPVSGSVTANAGTGTFTTQDLADASAGGVVAPAFIMIVGGKTADISPVYDPLPLAAGGGSVVVSGTIAVTQSTSPWVTKDAADGTPGLTGPSVAMQVAGQDLSNNLHVLSTDSSGKLNVNASVTGSFTPGLTSDAVNSGTITSTGNVAVSTQGAGTLFAEVSGTWVGTVVFEVLLPDTTTWVSAKALPKYPGTTGAPVSSITSLQLVIATVASASGTPATSVYTGTITGGTANAFAGYAFTIAGFANANNNGTFTCTASSLTTLTLLNSAGVTQSASATATEVQQLQLAVGAQDQFRVRGSTVTSGTASVYLEAGAGVQEIEVISTNASNFKASTTDSSDMVGTTPNTAPANTMIVGGIYNSSAPTPSNGQTLPLQQDASGNLQVNIKAGGSGTGTSNTAPVNGTWTTSTAANTAVAVLSGTFLYDTVVVTFQPNTAGGTTTGGAATFEVSNDNILWVTISGVNQTTGMVQGTFYTFTQTYTAFVFNTAGWQYMRVRLSTAIATGSGNIQVAYAAQSLSQVFPPNQPQYLSSLSQQVNLNNTSSTYPNSTTGISVLAFNTVTYTIWLANLGGTSSVCSLAVQQSPTSSPFTAGSNVVTQTFTLPAVAGGSNATYSVTVPVISQYMQWTATASGQTDMVITAYGFVAPQIVESAVLVATQYPTAVPNGTVTGSMGDKAGRAVSVLNTVRDLVGTQVLNSSSSSLVSFIAAGASGVFNDIITFIATNESSTATIVSLSDGTTTYKYALAGNGGIVINFPTPKPAASSSTAWQVSNSAAVAVDYEAIYAKNQ